MPSQQRRCTPEASQRGTRQGRRRCTECDGHGQELETGAERTVQSNAEGSYNILALPPGNYDVTVTSGNFAPFTQRAAVSVGGTATVDATLGVSGGATLVEVTAESAAVEVNTQTQEQSQIITPEQVAELPSLTRNPYDFIALAGNVSGGDRSYQSGNPQTSGGGQNNTDRGVGFFINGQRSSGTEILIDASRTPTCSTPPSLWKFRRMRFRNFAS